MSGQGGKPDEGCSPLPHHRSSCVRPVISGTETPRRFSSGHHLVHLFEEVFLSSGTTGRSHHVVIGALQGSQALAVGLARHGNGVGLARFFAWGGHPSPCAISARARLLMAARASLTALTWYGRSVIKICPRPDRRISVRQPGDESGVRSREPSRKVSVPPYRAVVNAPASFPAVRRIIAAITRSLSAGVSTSGH